MTDRHAGYLVTLAEDIREDDAEYTINALKMIKGVRSVRPQASRQARRARYRARTHRRGGS